MTVYIGSAEFIEQLQTERNEARAQVVTAGAEIMHLIADLGDCQDERDAAVREAAELREELGLMHAALESDAENRARAHDAVREARAEAAELREEVAALKSRIAELERREDALNDALVLEML